MRHFHSIALLATTLVLASGCASKEKSDTGEVPMAAIKPMANSQPTEKVPVTLKVGDAAPALSIEEWIKGSPVSGFESGKVYVIEFWATWCSPCVASIPHLNETQAKHPSVVVIGVAGSERRPAEGKSDTRVEGLKKFIDQRGDGMNYRVAYDEDRSMPNAWLRPAGQDGIPCAFIIGRDGKIAWIGHPVAMDSHLEEAIAAK